MANRPNKDDETKNPNPKPGEEGNPTPAGEHSGMQISPAVARALKLGPPLPLGSRYNQNVPTAFAGDVHISCDDLDPGIISIDYLPTFGYSDAPTSALNRAAYSQFNVIRKAIQGNRNYEPPDHMIYRMSVDSMRELYNVIARAYGCTKKYSAYNLYTPNTLLTALGFKADDWIANSNKVYQWLLNHKNALASFPTVKIGEVTDRHLAYAASIFTDSPHEYSQLYILRPVAFYSYEKVDEVKGLTLRMLKYGATVQDVFALWDTMYAALQTSFDVYRIASDIRTAFGDQVITDLPEIGLDYVTPIIFDPTTLTFIHNLHTVGLGALEHSSSEEALEDLLTRFRIYDNGGLVCCTPNGVTHAFKTGYLFSVCHPTRFLTFSTADPSDNDKVAAMRSIYVARTTYEDDATSDYYDSFGTEIYTGFRIYTLNPGGSAPVWEEWGTCMVHDSINNYHQSVTVDIMSRLSNFDYHPIVYSLSGASPNSAAPIFTQTLLADRFGDVQVVVPITDEEVKTYHDAYLLSVFDVD